MAKKNMEKVGKECDKCEFVNAEDAKSCKSCGRYFINNDALNIVMSEINKNMADEGIVLFKMKDIEDQLLNSTRISTGSLRVDNVLDGGIPRGARIELLGPDQAGKTTLALHIIASVQKLGGRAMFVDMEHSFNPKYAKEIGVDTEQLIIAKPSNGTIATDLMVKMVPQVQIIVLDSIATCFPNDHLLKETKKDKDTGEIINASSMAPIARLFSDFQPRWIKAHSSNPDCILILINQVRENMQMYSPDKYSSPGGRAVRHLADSRILIDTSSSKANVIRNDEGSYIGRKSKVSLLKWKYGFDRKEAEIEIRNKGIDLTSDIIALGYEFGVLKKGGAWWEYKDMKVQGEEALRTKLENDKALSDEIIAEIKRIMVTKNG